MSFKCGYLSGGLWIGPGANIALPCCYTSKNTYDVRPRVEDKTNLYNSQTIVEMRQAALEGKPHKLCQDCIHKSKSNIKNPISDSNRWMSNNGDVKLITSPEDLEILYFSLSNICNFKCVMCSAGLSHLIAKEQGITEPLEMVDEDFVREIIDLISSAKNLKKLQITGGEPFYNKKRLRQILENVNKNISFHVHTNGSIMDQETIEIIKLCQKFEFTNLLFSLDGSGSVFEYQRTNGVWKDIIKNLKTLKKHIVFKNIRKTACYTVSAFNLLDIPNFINRTNGLIDNYEFFELKWPSEFNIRFIKEPYLKRIISDLAPYQNNNCNLKEIILAAIKALENKPTEKEIDALWKKIDYMKNVRGIDLKEKIPEAYDFLYSN